MKKTRRHLRRRGDVLSTVVVDMDVIEGAPAAMHSQQSDGSPPGMTILARCIKRDAKIWPSETGHRIRLPWLLFRHGDQTR